MFPEDKTEKEIIPEEADGETVSEDKTEKEIIPEETDGETVSEDKTEKEIIPEETDGETVSEDKTNKKNKFLVFLIKALPVIMFIAITVIEYASIEFFLGDSIATIGFYYGMKNVLLIGAVNMIFVALFQYLKPALIISEVIVMIIGIANFFVDAFRGYGIVYMDFFAVKTATDVAGEYKYSVNANFFAGLCLIILCIVITILYTTNKHRYFGAKYILPSIAGIVIPVCFFFWAGTSITFFNDVNSLTWDHSIGMADYGYILYAVADAGDAEVEAPDGYSAEKADEILDKYTEENASNNVLTDYSTKVKSPNIIMIMNESFSDLSVLGEFGTSSDYLSFYRSLTENTIKGYAESSVYGGYTANSEFEFLTGSSKAFLPGNPYLQYVKNYIPSVISNIKVQDGYGTALAVHPYNASGYNRNRVYPLLGFDKFYDIKSFKNPTLVRDKYISDQSDYEMVEKLYEEKKEGTSLCLFNVTMQNHSPYDILYTFDDPVKIMSFSMQYQAEQYLSCMKQSDEALKQLITYFKKVDEPTVILMFGDHQPHLPDDFYKNVMGVYPEMFTQEQSMKEHLVPFMIWANYDIGSQTIEKTSLNYLSSMLLQKTGLEMTDYDRFMLAMSKIIPSLSATGYYDKDGKLYSWDDKNTKYSKLINEYKIVQYNYLFDTKNRCDEHFQLSSK